MNTSQEAIKQLQSSLSGAKDAADTIENLIAVHDYQDVAGLATLAAASLLEAATKLMEKDDTAAFGAIDDAEELIDAIYGIVDEDLDS